MKAIPLISGRFSMEGNKQKKAISRSRNIETMLRAHDRLEQTIRENFSKEVTILFTDICGYTRYTETRGDIRSRAMLQKHNDILMPLIQEHDGVVIKTIGDAVMATFDTPEEGVRSAISIQNALNVFNRDAEKSEGIHVKIGINTGSALVDDGDVFGDAVNVAARIQAKAGKDQILISENLFERICGTGNFLCRFHDTTELKGKSEPVNLYQVVWKEAEMPLNDPPKLRTYASDERRETGNPSLEMRGASQAPEDQIVLHLEAARVADRLKISAYEQFAGEAGTVRHYEEIPIPIETIGRRCREIAETLNKANRRGCVSADILMTLKELGQVFFDDLFTHTVKEDIRHTTAEHLILSLDDTLAHIPWELLHDGDAFLCQRFNMGRLVRTRQAIPGNGKARKLGKPLRMLILADPGGDLNGAYAEGVQLRDTMDSSRDILNVSLRTEGITADYVREKMRNFDFLHYAGHSDYEQENQGQSGWRLKGGRFRANEIMKMAGTGDMPALIFSNACQSARTEGWEIKESFQDEIFGLANAFVLAGVKHYVGTFWEIPDEPSRRFALEFYKLLLSGMTVGEAVRHARFSLMAAYGEESILWASYLLYGDPTFNYLEQVKERPPDFRRSELGTREERARPNKKIRAPEEAIDLSDARPIRRRRGRGLKLIAGLVLFLAVLLWGYPGILRTGTAEYEKTLLEAYHAGNFDAALAASEHLEETDPRIRLTYLIRGDIYLRQGKIKAAQTEYRQAIQASKGTDQQKAAGLMGLGRIASIGEQTAAALNYYRQATAADPEKGTGYLSMAWVMSERGDAGEALELLERAWELTPDDRLISSVIRDLRKQFLIAQDQEKQARINALVKELLESTESQITNHESRITNHESQITNHESQITNHESRVTNHESRIANHESRITHHESRITLWIMDFAVQGYAMQEGEAWLLHAGIAEGLIEKSRIQLVERAVLDKLLEELKLGTSRLADRNTALSVGRLLAARLIMTGQIVHAGPQTQVSLRVIETETGLISAAVTETFGAAVPAAVLAEKLSETLIDKLEKRYSLPPD